MSENTNTQAPAGTTATPAGQSVEEIRAEFEKQREGLIRDLQQERSKRQELEAQLSSPAPSAVKQDVQQDELAKVLDPYISPLSRELEALRLEKAQNYLVEKTGKSWDAIEADRDFQSKMLGVVKKYGITGNVHEKTMRAYELMQLEDLKAKEQERARAAQTNSVSSMPSGTPPAPVTSQREYSAAEFSQMSSAEFDRLSSEGTFKKIGDKFVYVK